MISWVDLKVHAKLITVMLLLKLEIFMCESASSDRSRTGPKIYLQL